jgi:hypothetical protein
MDQQSKKLQWLLKDFLKLDFNQENDLKKIQKKIISVLKGKEKYDVKYLNVLNTIQKYNPVVLKKFITQYSNQNKNLDVFYKSFISNKQNLAVIEESKGMDDVLMTKEEQDQLKKLFSTIEDIGLNNSDILDDEELQTNISKTYSTILDEYKKSVREYENKSLEDLEKAYEDTFETVSIGGKKVRIQTKSSEDAVEKMKIKIKEDNAIFEELKKLKPIELIDFSRKYSNSKEPIALSKFFKKYQNNRTENTVKDTVQGLKYIQKLNTLSGNDQKMYIDEMNAATELSQTIKNIVNDYYITKSATTSSLIPVLGEASLRPIAYPKNYPLLQKYLKEKDSLFLPDISDIVNDTVESYVTDFVSSTLRDADLEEIKNLVQYSKTNKLYVGTDPTTGAPEFKEEPVENINEFLSNVNEEILKYKSINESGVKSSSLIDDLIYNEFNSVGEVFPNITDNNDVAMVAVKYFDNNTTSKEIQLIRDIVDNQNTLNDKMKKLIEVLESGAIKDAKFLQQLIDAYAILVEYGDVPVEQQKIDLVTRIKNAKTQEERKTLSTSLKELLLFEYLQQIQEQSQIQLNEKYDKIYEKTIEEGLTGSELNRQLELEKNRLKAETEAKIVESRNVFINTSLDNKVKDTIDSLSKKELAPDLFDLFDKSLKRKSEEMSGEEPVYISSKKSKPDMGSHKTRNVCVSKKCGKNLGKTCIVTLMVSPENKKKMVDMKYCCIKCLENDEYAL